uniref:Uncharacterized protein n=1 Tax=Avena sativa TaxID=4498 RepID=A0ACD5ZK95_AVESA
MSCRTAASTLLTAALLISLLALDHPIAHARHVKDQHVPTAASASASANKGLQQHGVDRKLDGGKTRKFETVGAKMPNGEDAQQSFGSNSRNGGGLGAESSKAARRGGGPVPHPKKHN